MIALSFILLFLYVILMILLITGYKKISLFEAETTTVTAKFSVVIPFRDEAENLHKLLASFKKLEYPKELYEVIFIDDGSTDASIKIITNQLSRKEIDFSIIKNKRVSGSPKKDAISLAIQLSKNQWIITTDADGVLPQKWLECFDTFIATTKTVCIAAPVIGMEDNSLQGVFQQLDIMSLQTTTVGLFGLNNPLLCNGANFAYTKEAFEVVGGFKDNTHIASGDDIFLLEKMIAHFPRKVHYLKSKNAVVKTSLHKSWRDILIQRVRWASKTTKQQKHGGKMIGLLVSLFNIWLLVMGVMSFINKDTSILLAVFLVIKLCLDYAVIKQTANFVKLQIPFGYFILNSLLYPIITFLVFILSLRGNYLWKGRNFKQ